LLFFVVKADALKQQIANLVILSTEVSYHIYGRRLIEVHAINVRLICI